jgi:integrase
LASQDRPTRQRRHTPQAPKTTGSERKVPLRTDTADILAGYLAQHPHSTNPAAPLFPDLRLHAASRKGCTYPAPTPQPRGPKAHGGTAAREPWRNAATRQMLALAQVSVPEHAARLVLDWDKPLVHKHLYRAVFQPATVRAGLSHDLKFHSLRHTYASLCIAAGIEPLKLSRRLGHNKVSTTLNIYTHLFPTEDHSDDMARLDVLAEQATAAQRAAANTANGTANVFPIRRR